LPFETYPTLTGVLTKFESEVVKLEVRFHVWRLRLYPKIVVKDMEVYREFCEQADHSTAHR
jgi:hypothetical protein